MELVTLLERVNSKQVTTPSCFLEHLKRIQQCTTMYFDERDEDSMLIVATAHTLMRAGPDISNILRAGPIQAR